MAHTWNYDRASVSIANRIKEVSQVTIVDYVRDTSLESIPRNKGYRVNGVHLYADILNMDEMLGTTDIEGERCHKKTLRFLNLHYRAVSRILSRTDTRRVDFHNQRLHSLVTKPYNTETDAEAKRIHKAVAIGQLIIDVLDKTGDSDESIPNAKVRIGIDSGQAIAVNNGRSGNREPLFLGEPANLAAKLSGGGSAKGIFLTSNARKAVGLVAVSDPKRTALTKAEIQISQNSADLDVTEAEIVDEWKKDLKKNPIGVFEFSRHTPPFRTMEIASLTPANSRRQEAVSIYADIDGFTAYVKKHIDDNPKDVVRALHVIRAELERVVTSDFDGRRIRFIGDCIHGLICEGTSKTTDVKETISSATLCSGALRSSFDLALEKLASAGIDVSGLGLQIGFEYGWMTVTRLGIQGDRVRCSVSRGVLRSEEQQMRCNNDETAIGQAAYDEGTEAVRLLFGSKRKVSGLDYNEITERLASASDESAKSSKRAAYSITSSAMEKAANRIVTPYSK